MNPILYRRIISSSSSVDPLLTNPMANHFYYVALVGANGGVENFHNYYGVSISTFKSAINDVFNSLDLAGLTSKIKRWTPRIGSIAGTQAVNAINPGTYDGIFNIGASFSTSGVTFDGISGYELTQFKQSNFTSLSNLGYSFKNITSAGDGTYLFGVNDGGTYTSIFTAFGTDYFYDISSASYVIREPRSDGEFHTIVRNGTSIILYINGVSVDTTTVGVSGGGSTYNIIIGALNNNGTIGNYSASSLRNEVFHDYLTAQETEDLYNILLTFDTALGR